MRYKLDFLMPTGSFKDRGMTVMISYLKPTSATAAAGLTQLLAGGAIRPAETTVLVLTGS